MKHHLPLAALSLLLAALAAQAGAFERKPFDRSRFAQAEAAGKKAVAAAATEAPAVAAPPAASAQAKSALRGLFGSDLLTHEGKKADLAELNDKIIAIYFSASWCPPCRAFSPLLVDLADRLQAEGKPFALVLVGRDQTKQKALDYMKSHKMTGYLIPPEADANKSLCTLYRVSGIPYLVIVDSDGNTIDPVARATVQSTPDTAWGKWSR